MPEGAVHFVLLEAPKELIQARLAARHHEYMNPALLDSQLKTLEVPDEKEGDAFRVVNDRAPEVVAGEILKHLR
jgi:gluconokinase